MERPEVGVNHENLRGFVPRVRRPCADRETWCKEHDEVHQSKEKNMPYSSFMGAGRAPMAPSGRGSDMLGPSDNSDSGSDTVGSNEARADSDAAGSGERSSVDLEDTVDGGDISPDKVVRIRAPRGISEDDEGEEGGGEEEEVDNETDETEPVDVSDMVNFDDEETEGEEPTEALTEAREAR